MSKNKKGRPRGDLKGFAVAWYNRDGESGLEMVAATNERNARATFHEQTRTKARRIILQTSEGV